MRPTVIYVHGNGNKVRAELLKSQWDKALFGHDMGDGSRMAYWASLRYSHPLPDPAPKLAAETPAAPAEIASAEAAPPEVFVTQTLSQAQQDTARTSLVGTTAAEGVATPNGAVLVGWLRRMTYFADALAEDAEDEPTAEVRPGVLPLPGPVRKAALRLLVQQTFKDVYAYFFGDMRQEIQDVVKRALDGLDGPVVVVGHSLGSIIAYEVLRKERAEAELFVTVGSPLGITEVQDQLTKPLKVPAGVRSWRNASDIRDLVALDHTIASEYAPRERVRDFLVTNTSDNHHEIHDYLACGPVRHAVYKVFGVQGVSFGPSERGSGSDVA